MNKNKSFKWILLQIVICTTIICLFMMFVNHAVKHIGFKKETASIWHEGDEVVFKNNGPRMMVIKTEDSTFVVCKYYNYVKGNFITEAFKDSELERIEYENNK